MAYRKVITIIFSLFLSFSAFARTVDEKIGAAMNRADWFALDSLYSATPKDSIDPFLEIFSRCLIGNRLNRTDVSIPAFQELLNSQSLDLGNMVSSLYMFGMDLSREGYNAEAASIINSVVSQTKQYLDSATVDGLMATAGRYAALSEYHPYLMEYPDARNSIVPFSIVPVGPKDKGSVLMHLRNCTINGAEADITFDTGAGTNMISHEMAERYGLTPLEDTKITVAGVGKRDGMIAIAKELKFGDILVKDVPFTVISLSSGNEDADQYIDCFNIVLGSELMLQLGDLTIDFVNNNIIIPTEVPARTDATPNMCFSSGMNLLTKGMIQGAPALMCIDSGDASYGYLCSEYYERDKEYIARVGRLDTIRSAGIAGVSIMPCYYVPDINVTIGSSTVNPAGLVVKTQADNAHNINIGLRTLMLFDRLRFNMVDFVLTAEPSANLSSLAGSGHKMPDIKFTNDNGVNLWQAIGMIGVGVARTMINPNAPDIPDL